MSQLFLSNVTVLVGNESKNTVAWTVFFLVAGAGLEPATFGL